MARVPVATLALRVALAIIVLSAMYAASHFSRHEDEAADPRDAPSTAAESRPTDVEPKLESGAPRANSPQRKGNGTAASENRSPKTLIRNVVIRDESGAVAYRGDVDLSATLARIRAGDKLSFRNDGSVFQNRERRLPTKPAGYYREWVHPTPKLSGPGPQRVVTGSQGEAYYTPDHYRTFQKIE